MDCVCCLFRWSSYLCVSCLCARFLVGTLIGHLFCVNDVDICDRLFYHPLLNVSISLEFLRHFLELLQNVINRWIGWATEKWTTETARKQWAGPCHWVSYDLLYSREHIGSIAKSTKNRYTYTMLFLSSLLRVVISIECLSQNLGTRWVSKLIVPRELSVCKKFWVRKL